MVSSLPEPMVQRTILKKKKKTKEDGIYIGAGLQFMLCLITQPSMRRVIEGYSYQTTVQREVCVISVQFREQSCPHGKP